MVYEYASYYRIYFMFPLVVLTAVVVVAAVTAIQMYRAIRKARFTKKDFVKMLPLACVWIWFAIICISTLASGGVWLCTEEASDAVSSVGIVSDIEKIGKYEVHICINGDKYIVLDEGDFAEGDQVEFTFLPRSRFILTID